MFSGKRKTISNIAISLFAASLAVAAAAARADYPCEAVHADLMTAVVKKAVAEEIKKFEATLAKDKNEGMPEAKIREAETRLEQMRKVMADPAVMDDKWFSQLRGSYYSDTASVYEGETGRFGKMVKESGEIGLRHEAESYKSCLEKNSGEIRKIGKGISLLQFANNYMDSSKTALAIYYQENGHFPEKGNAWKELGFSENPSDAIRNKFSGDAHATITFQPKSGAFVIEYAVDLSGIGKGRMVVTPNVGSTAITWNVACTPGDALQGMLVWQCNKHR